MSAIKYPNLNYKSCSTFLGEIQANEEEMFW